VIICFSGNTVKCSPGTAATKSLGWKQGSPEAKHFQTPVQPLTFNGCCWWWKMLCLCIYACFFVLRYFFL